MIRDQVIHGVLDHRSRNRGCIVVGIRKLMVKEVIGLNERHSVTYGAEPGESNFELSLSVP